MLGGTYHLVIVSNHSKSPNWGCGTPSKWLIHGGDPKYLLSGGPSSKCSPSYAENRSIFERWSVSWVQPLILNWKWSFSISHLTKVPPQKKIMPGRPKKIASIQTWCFGQLVLRLEGTVFWLKFIAESNQKKTIFSSGSQLDVCLVARVDIESCPPKRELSPQAIKKGLIFWGTKVDFASPVPIQKMTQVFFQIF